MRLLIPGPPFTELQAVSDISSREENDSVSAALTTTQKQQDSNLLCEESFCFAIHRVWEAAERKHANESEGRPQVTGNKQHK